MAAGYLCIRTLRFTNDGLNIAFGCAFLLLPFLAIRPTLRLRGLPRALAVFFLAPVLAISLFSLFTIAVFDIPAAVRHAELSRELGSVRQGHYSVHLLWEETAGGALGPHGVGLEQRMFIVPGLYIVKHIAWFDEAYQGSLSAEGLDKVRVRIPKNKFRSKLTGCTR
jgi:hypothetical protein